MAEIKIKSRTNNLGYHFNIEVTDQNGFASYRVSMGRDFILRIGADYEPELIVRKSFEFLLSKEPKEKIMEEFDLTIITQFFPEYISTLEKMLQNDPTPNS